MSEETEAIPADTLRALVAAARPELADASIEFLGDGCDHDNFLVGERYVLRVPKSAEVEKRLITEVALLGRLDLTLKTPRPSGPHRHDAHPRVYALYPFLPGVPGDIAERFDDDFGVRALGGLLLELHAFDVDEASALGVSVMREPERQWRAVVNRVAKDVPDVLSRVPPELLDPSGLPAQRQSVLLHADLGGEHVLVDPESGRSTAVIDWADAAVGDPALDYAGLLGWRGERFLIRALERAGIAYDQDDLTRARFFALAVAIHSISLGRKLGKETWVAAGERVVREVEKG